MRWNGRAFLLLSILLLTALSVACNRNWHPPADGQWPPPTPTPSCPNQTCGVVSFETVSQGDLYFPPDTFIPQTHVIRDASAWEQFWPDDGTRPEIDFSHSIIIAVEDAWFHPPGGTPIRIDRIVAAPAGLTVEATGLVFGPNCGPSSWHHIVTIPWTDLPAELDLTIEPGICLF